MKQRSLLEEHPGKALLCLTVQLPGPEKRSDLSLKIAADAVSAIRREFRPVREELRDLETGYEGYFLVDATPEDAKRRAVALESAERLGRLWDLDVILADGAVVRPLSREELGFAERQCLLCEKPAHYCIRARAHSWQQILDRIKEMVYE